MMNELTIILTFIFTIAALLIGFSLGKNQAVITPDVQRKISQIFKRVVPKSDVGPVERPNQLDNYYRDNPEVAREHGLMDETLDVLSKQ